MIPYGNKRAKLSAADKERALVMFFNGDSHDVIAATIHCTASNVYTLTRRFRPIGKARPRNHPRLVQRYQ